MQVYKNIEVLREAKGMSKRGLAKAADVSPEYISKIEAGQISSPGLDILEKIAGALEVHLSEVIFGATLEGEPKKAPEIVLDAYQKKIAAKLEAITGKKDREFIENVIDRVRKTLEK